jgi:hypothetical protein
MMDVGIFHNSKLLLLNPLSRSGFSNAGIKGSVTALMVVARITSSQTFRSFLAKYE